MRDKEKHLLTLSVLGVPIKIIETSDILVHTCGKTIQEDGIIWLREDQIPSVKTETLLHEIIHNINWAILAEDNRLSEQQVCAISRGLYSVFTDNGLDLKEITERWSDYGRD